MTFFHRAGGGGMSPSPPLDPLLTMYITQKPEIKVIVLVSLHVIVVDDETVSVRKSD